MGTKKSHVLLRIYTNGEPTRHVVIWDINRWTDYKHRDAAKKGVKQSDLEKKHVMGVGTYRAMMKLRDVYDRMSKGE